MKRGNNAPERKKNERRLIQPRIRHPSKFKVKVLRGGEKLMRAGCTEGEMGVRLGKTFCHHSGKKGVFQRKWAECKEGRNRKKTNGRL